MLLLVRHGETDSNRRGHLLGRADPPLTPTGWEQARTLATRLPRPDVVVSSPLLRARQTAAVFGGEVRVDERWIELDYGEFDGVPLRDVPADVWREWRANPTFAPPGGESLTTLGARVRAACAEMVDELQHHDVVVVSHVSPIKAAIAWALDTGDELSWRLFVQVGSITRISVDDYGPTLRSFNELPR